MYINELSQARLALGGNIKLTIVTDMSQSDSKLLFDEMWRKIFTFERRFSRFIPMSELSIFNRTTGIKNQISPEFKELLITAKNLGEETGGLYNPFVTPALQKAGYKKSALIGHKVDKQIDYTGRRVVAVENIEIGENWAMIPYGTALDFGGCGKGYLADKIGLFLKTKSVVGYWLSFDGDISTYGTDKNGKNIAIDIADAGNLIETKDLIIKCPKTQFGIATSGTNRRKNQTTNSNWHHIIDPNTLKPVVTDISLATVCAETTLLADVLASCAVILGSEKAMPFLKKHGAKSVLLQFKNEKGEMQDKSYGSCLKKVESFSATGVYQNA